MSKVCKAACRTAMPQLEVALVSKWRLWDSSSLPKGVAQLREGRVQQYACQTYLRPKAGPAPE